MADTPGAGPSRRVRPTAADYLTDDEGEDMEGDEPMNVDPEPMDVDHDWNAPIPGVADGAQPQHNAPQKEQDQPPPRKHKKYHRQPGEKAAVLEDENLKLEGEEESEDGALPLRILTNFVIVEQDEKRMRPIDPEKNIVLEAIGYATRAVEPDEDAGQEDEGQDDDGPLGVRIRTTRLISTSCDYLNTSNIEITVRTKHASYILRTPDEQYREVFAERMRLINLTALLLSLGHDPMNAPEVASLDEFKEKARYLVLDGKACTNLHIKSAAYQIKKLLPRLEVTEEVRLAIRNHPIIIEALRLLDYPHVGFQESVPIEHRRLLPPRLEKLTLTYDPNDPHDLTRLKIDKDVMKPHNLTQNIVLPRIGRLTKGWTHERLRLLGGELGPRRRQWDKVLYRQDLEAAIQCAGKAPKAKVLANVDGKLIKPDRRPSAKWRQPFRVHGVVYNVGDAVLFPIDKDLPKELPEDARIEHYFRFGKILYVDIKEGESVHIMWYDHSSRTALGLPPASDERELMLTSRCESVWARELCGVVRVLEPGTGLELKDGIVSDQIDAHYFCRLSYDRSRPSFADLAPLPELVSSENDPRGCPTCICDEEEDIQGDPRYSEPRGVPTVFYKGEQFHKGDNILFTSGVEGEIPGPPGVGSLGRIVKWEKTDRGPVAQVAQFVRQGHCEFEDAGLGDLDVDGVKDPRQLFSTTYVISVSAARIVRKIYVRRVAHSSYIWTPAMGDIKNWLDASPDHFIVKWHFESLEPTADGSPPKLRWYSEKRLMEDLSHDERAEMVCKPCSKAKRREYKLRSRFAERREPVKILDLCSGTGAFSMGIKEGMGCRAEIRYAVEISPSAMASFKKYSPGTTAFNTCINTFGDYMYKYNTGTLDPNEEWQNLDGTAFAVPPAPGEIDAIVVGLPCQPHSIMNRFKHDDDAKSNLVFTVLSIIEHLQPKHIFFENVRGIMSFALAPTTNVIPEGLKHTGLNFLCACLAALGYQFSFQLMNAAGHGTPQHRIRWFLMAAKIGEPLPKFPLPTHFYPDAGKDASSLSLLVHPGSKDPARPLKPRKGEYLYSHVSVRDAIEDLWAFDMTNPGTIARQHNISLPSETHLDPELRRLRTHRCRADWNPGADENDDVLYLCCPRDDYLSQALNRLQLEARVDPSGEVRPSALELQHFTKFLGEEHSEFICNIPMNERSKRNYLGLPNGFQSRSRMLHDATSSNARRGHKGNYFARADKDGVFQTTVTNIGPAATQSKCLHPWAYRVFTVRELARSQGFPDRYKFVALNNDIVTMHRQIGNAVPWPIGRALGREYGEVLFRQWCKENGHKI
ncbi:unnamed protein product [Peniophora sp. CBMAI 1063]|nr:unnamed protein product [Peniophora sp. CBMAI 1063]